MEKPILFNTEMVKAILEGKKTQTRRIIKPANPFRNKEGYSQGNGLWIDGYSKSEKPNGSIKDYSISSCWMDKTYYIQKYGPCNVGDILWVRETWNNLKDEDGDNYVYKADGGWDELSWHPSIHMPRAAARLFLKVTNVRAERLQDIDNKKCYNNFAEEGISTGDLLSGYIKHPVDMRMNFINIWNSTLKKIDLNQYGWDANPWVWVIKFERTAAPDETEGC